MSWGDQFAPRYYVAGAIKQGVAFDKRTAVGPASYTQGTGIAVDLSAVFSTLHGVKILRVYVTATDAHSPYKVEVHQAGTDTFANRKFRILFYQQNDPDAASGNVQGQDGSFTVLSASDTPATGTPSATQTDPDTGVGGPSVPSATHTHTYARNFVAQHQHAVTKAAAAFPEVAGATNLSTITVEYEAAGVRV